MKKVINGKVYNTETAREIGYYWNGFGSGDFDNLCETLYITKKGNYFLFGEGGARTKYGEHIGKMIYNGSDIIPFDREEAFSWAQENLTGNVVEENFSDLIEEA